MREVLTDPQGLVQVPHEGVFALAAELSVEVIQVKGPDEGTTELLVLQVFDLERGNEGKRIRFQFLDLQNNKKKLGHTGVWSFCCIPDRRFTLMS